MYNKYTISAVNSSMLVSSIFMIVEAVRNISSHLLPTKTTPHLFQAFCDKTSKCKYRAQVSADERNGVNSSHPNHILNLGSVEMDMSLLI